MSEKPLTLSPEDSIMEPIRRAIEVAPPKVLERVPVPRLVNPLSWEVKLQIAARRFAPGFVIGAVVKLAAIVEATPAIGWSVLTSPAVLLGVLLSGVLGGLGLGGYKYAVESNKDRKLTSVREEVASALKSQGPAILSYVVTALIELTEKCGLHPTEALAKISAKLDDIGGVPQEVGEFLNILAQAISAEGEAGSGVTVAEVQAIVKEAKDVKAATALLIAKWNAKP